MSNPVGAKCNIRWKNDGQEYQVYIHFGDYDDFDDSESHIFFFCENEEELKNLDEEFEILDYEVLEGKMSEQYYSRKCDVCNKGMEEGFLLAGFEYACSKECLEKMPNYSWKTYLEDNAIDGDNTYYTSWEQDWNSEETLFLADGTEVDNPFFESDLELLRLRHNEGETS